ncbi:MAG: hypothetical protein H6716_23555 [Polyangiaceae bacterium]|nr:hypothetical protein [Polyangiaceae bacterium]
MTGLAALVRGREDSLPNVAFFEAWFGGGVRRGDERVDLDAESELGRWPGDLETDAVVRLAEAVGDDPSWESHAATPPVAQRLAERAQLQTLDLAIVRHLQHLQHVCHKPRLHLRVEEERLPVSRARRTPVRAVADLVSHPGDWEHRTLRSIQPSRVLARQIEDEWNLYENRVATRLVDHLLAYLAKRLEELRRIMEILDASRDYGAEIQRTSFRRAHRISELWSSTLESKTEEELRRTIKRLELAQRDLRALLDAPLYKHVPRRQAVALSLKSTNILVSDPHYRKVAWLWLSWVKFGRKRQETTQQRALRRQGEASAWSRFVLHLVVRGFAALGWSSTPASDGGWALSKPGWMRVKVAVGTMGSVQVTTDRTLRLLPLCADLLVANPDAVLARLKALDAPGAEVVVVHVGASTALADADRASGWSIGGRAVLLASSPWGIDSEERMARVLNGWLSRAAAPPYPASTTLRALPEYPNGRDWLRHDGDHLVAFRAPSGHEAAQAQAWATAKARELDADAQRAKAAKQAFSVAPREDVGAFVEFLNHAAEQLAGLSCCPVCGDHGQVEPRPGKRSDGGDATWWAVCGGCRSEWGTRPCTECGSRYRALLPQTGLDLASAARSARPSDWPDKVLGRDVWAPLCPQRPNEQFRCPDCGRCGDAACMRCARRR